jgi:hypothetical protein
MYIGGIFTQIIIELLLEQLERKYRDRCHILDKCLS